MVQGIARNDAQVRRAAGDLVAQLRATLAWLRELDAGSLATPAPAPGAHSVRDVVGHLLVLVSDMTEATHRGTALRPTTLTAHLRSASAENGRLHARTAQAMGAEETSSLVTQLVHAGQELELALGDELPPVLQASFEPLRTPDLLKAAIVELVQYGDDLNEALPTHATLPLERNALFTAVRVLSTTLGELRPGHSVEVRVPPAAAVQIASEHGGPTHTRGTPPAVVEMAPRVFLRLATGRITWAEAVARRHVNASGVHADLSAVFPLVRL